VRRSERPVSWNGPTDDAIWMRRALRIAERGFTAPNPMVGCVLVRDGVRVGEGYHLVAGGPHAEVNALRAAGNQARGATAYVTLEPCSHFGRTPPCADALIEAGVSRVVAAVTDPNPKVAGTGLKRLRAAGMSVEVGLMAVEAERLNDAFFHFQRTGRPFVIQKAAQTLDGKIATRTGDSRWVTGEKARAFVHRLRARSGAVLVGVGTAIADDPLLTARLPGDSPRQPVRIVLDPHLRLPPNGQLARTARETPTLVVTRHGADPSRSKTLHTCGIEILPWHTDTDDRIELTSLMDELGRREIVSILVEGGATTHAAFLEARLANRLLWFVAPKVVGGREAPSAVGGNGIALMADAIGVDSLRIRRFGPDILLDGTPVWGR
jgi:diaminohydroxyphosphoribosylaminopyrimidine deaminase / 5-amino-6-(5-phosphoribosylamino)uracil reductase